MENAESTLIKRNETLFDFVATLDLVDLGNNMLQNQLCCFKVAGEELFFL